MWEQVTTGFGFTLTTGFGLTILVGCQFLLLFGFTSESHKFWISVDLFHYCKC